MTKMAVTRIYGKKNFKIFFSETKEPMALNLGMQHRVLEYYQVSSNDDTGWVDIGLFYDKVNFGLL